MRGLTLAHALQGQADVVLLEQDPHAAAAAGYRISINHQACRPLKDARQAFPPAPGAPTARGRR